MLVACAKALGSNRLDDTMTELPIWPIPPREIEISKPRTPRFGSL